MIKKPKEINLEDYFASKQIDCANYLTDDEFETLQGLHKKVALFKGEEKKCLKKKQQ